MPATATKRAAAKRPRIPALDGIRWAPAGRDPEDGCPHGDSYSVLVGQIKLCGLRMQVTATEVNVGAYGPGGRPQLVPQRAVQRHDLYEQVHRGHDGTSPAEMPWETTWIDPDGAGQRRYTLTAHPYGPLTD